MFRKINPILQPIKKAKTTFAEEIETLLKVDDLEKLNEETEEKMDLEKSEYPLTFNKAELKEEDNAVVSTGNNIGEVTVDNTVYKILVSNTPVFTLNTNPKDLDEVETISKSIPDEFKPTSDGTSSQKIDLVNTSERVAVFVSQFLTMIHPVLWKEDTEQYLTPFLGTIFGTPNLKDTLVQSLSCLELLREQSRIYREIEAKDPREYAKFNFPKYEEEYQEQLLKLSVEYERQMGELFEIIKSTTQEASSGSIVITGLPDTITPGETGTPIVKAPNTSEGGQTTNENIGSLLKTVASIVTKLNTQLKDYTKIKKENAELRLAVERARREGATKVTSSTQEEKEIKIMYENLLGGAMRTKLSTYNSYTFALSLAGKLHLRSEQSIFIFDISALIRGFIQNKIKEYRSLSLVQYSSVQTDLQSVFDTNITIFSGDSQNPEGVLRSILAPAYLYALDSAFAELLKFLHPSSKPLILNRLLILDPLLKTQNKLYAAFVNFVASKYNTDLQLQKNIATTASDKIVQSVAKIQSIDDMKKAMIEAGYRLR